MIEAYTGPEHAVAEEKVMETPPMNDVDDEVEPEEPVDEPEIDDEPEIPEDMTKYLTAMPASQSLMEKLNELVSSVDYRILIVVAVIAVVLARRS